MSLFGSQMPPFYNYFYYLDFLSYKLDYTGQPDKLKSQKYEMESH